MGHDDNVESLTTSKAKTIYDEVRENIEHRLVRGRKCIFFKVMGLQLLKALFRTCLSISYTFSLSSSMADHNVKLQRDIHIFLGGGCLGEEQKYINW